MIDGLGPMDSFILDVLRGWRLLVAASLTNDEWRDILASTGNKLDYPAIAEALQTLWDEQLNHHHGASKGTVLQQHWVETADPWYNAAWHESSWDTEDWHESDWHSMDQFGAWPQAANDPVDNTATTDDDPELQEALEAEKAAEALAVEARRTWSQAQQATTALRRDRGFGQFAGTSSSKGGKGNIRCHICSGPHFARDCPDRQHPQYRKGGGKQLSPAELDAYFFKGKGKGMRKGKDQMMSSWDDSYMAPWDVMYTQKGKNKNAGKGGKLRSTVNVYGMDYGGMDFSMMELHTLEFHETMEAVPLELYTSNETPAPETFTAGMQLQVGGPSGDWFELAVNESDSCHVSAVDVHVTKQSTSMSTGFELLFQRRKLLNEQSHSAALGCPVGSTSLTGYKTATPLDPERRQGHDLKDPRAQPSCWPCLGKHVPSVTGSNAHGSWAKCAVCALRVEYIPRQGSPASSVVHKDHTFVDKALSMIQEGIPKGTLPDYEMVEKTYDYVEAMDKIRAMKAKISTMEAEAQGMLNSLEIMYNGSKKKTTKATEAERILAHLTPEEWTHVSNLASQRQAGQSSTSEMIPFSPSSDVEVEEITPAKAKNETLGTTVPELQIEQFAKKVQFSDAPPEVHQFVDTTAETASEVPDQEYTCETVEFELLKIDEGKSNKSSRRGKSRRAAKHEMEEQLSSAPSRSSGLSVLPWRICQAVMALSSMLLLVAQNDLSTLLRGHQQVDVWEIFCAPDSWLSSACHSEGLTASRINLHQNFDMYRADTYDELWDKFKRERPREEQIHSLQLEAMPQELEDDDEPNAELRKQWDIQLLKYHKAAGHPNNYNLARIIREAGQPRWKVEAALKLGKWYKLLVLMDFATHFKAGKILRSMDLYKQENENTTEILEGIFDLWLASKPKMTILVPDNAKSMVSAQARTTLSDLNIQIEVPPAKESWSHGLMERAVQEVKIVASKTALSFPALSAKTILALSINSLNATEVVQGYTPHQWVYGKQFSFSEEDERSMQQILPDVSGTDFISLLSNRQQAEEIARKVTERERLDYEISNPEDPSHWRSLADMVPRRSYIDLLPEEPTEEDVELPPLPDEPGPSTLQDQRPPEKRHRMKSPWSPLHGPQPPPAVPSLEYTPSEAPLNESEDQPTHAEPDDTEEVTGTGIGSGIPTLGERFTNLSDNKPLISLSSDSSKASASDSAAEPDSKKARLDSDALIFHALEMCEEGWILDIELDVKSQREKERFIKHPSLFLAQKLRDCEVRLEKLSPAHRELFVRAKSKEVNSFLTNVAVRRCLDSHEEREAWDSGRIMRCRWVLTWKPTPEESMEEALQEVASKPGSTTLTSDGKKKAKARIVLLGFEHPDLLHESHRTSSPVQAVLTRNLSYQLVMEEGWDIEGIDMSTAFLQTLPTEESKRLWTTGVKELRDALQIPERGVMRILKNFYGSTTAPRNLWENVDKSLRDLGAVSIQGDACFWIWFVDNEAYNPATDPEHFKLRPLGFMAGHVDDFHRAGDVKDSRWTQIKAAIDKQYRWGTAKQNSYRHAGTDLSMQKDAKFGRCLVVDQQFYIEMLQDVDVHPTRFSNGSSTMTPKEIAACRTSLGALQWLAVQSQPLITARCNLLITELSTDPKIQIAQELQEMIRELRKEGSTLKFFKLPGVRRWTDLCVVGLGDQAHNNRPRGGSTGGMTVFLSGPDALKGVPTPMCLVAWRSWKLKRVAIGTNDAEMQAIVETEDVVYRTRLLWAGMHGTGSIFKGRDLLSLADSQDHSLSGAR
ncbi:unnamed protein product [Durusdinium trenchii]|uniref:Integrase catalytic domain-containing protein n=1 Tax=Durusdinium trenchii TaxID=1381693 RepID=A0ABP0IZS0_9DINO